MKRWKNLNKITKHIILIGLIFLIILSYNLMDIGCVFKRIFGIACPTCGITRSFLMLLRLNILESLKFHPFLIPIVILFFLYIHKSVSIFHISNKLLDILFYILAILIFILWIYRSIFDTWFYKL